MYASCIKRLLDVLLSVVALVLLSPVLLAVAVLVAVRLGRPVIFRQVRPGKGGRLFRICKFRTMTDATDEEGSPLPDEMRLTSFGRRLRATSLDELPELWNILKGDMSIVGPRPLLADYLPRYNAFQARRHEACPGLTGLAQVSGRNAITWEEKFAYDVAYVDNLSFALDCRIVGKTFRKVFAREGIGSGTADTPEDFMGTPTGWDDEEAYSRACAACGRSRSRGGGQGDDGVHPDARGDGGACPSARIGNSGNSGGRDAKRNARPLQRADGTEEGRE